MHTSVLDVFAVYFLFGRHLYNDGLVTSSGSPVKIENSNSRLSSDTPYLLFYTSVQDPQSINSLTNSVSNFIYQTIHATTESFSLT